MRGKFLFLVFCLMIMVHFIIFVIYSKQYNSAEFKVNRDIIARQVINFIQTIHNTPAAEQAKLVKAVDIPHLKVSIDTEPKTETQFEQVSLWHILKNISTQSPTIQLSYQLTKNRWLNIYAEIIHSTWGLQGVLLSLELILIIAILGTYWIVHRFTVPLKNFAEAADRLGVDLNTEPLPIAGPKVARMAAKAINNMQARIQDLIQARTQMLAAISHDLRTPITRLKLRMQFIDDNKQFEKISHDLDEMETMIAETLAFVREDDKTEKRVNLDLASLLSVLCENYVETGHNVKCIIPEQPIPVNAGAVSLQRLFGNLIGNALKYAGSATMKLVTDKQDITVTVRDDGPGIAENQLNKVFLPFYRGEHSRSRETGGTGLGLAVAQDIVMAHGGSIELTNHPDGGLLVTVILPFFN